MNITVTFNDLDEVRAFAAMISGQTAEDQAPDPVVSQNTTMPQTAQQPTVPVTHAVPVEPVQPVTAVQSAVPTAPVQPVAAVPTQSQIPVASQIPTAPAQPAVPTSTHTYTPDELAKAAMQLMDSGKQNELLALLQQFGTNSIPLLQPSQYGAFATALRGMGAQI